MYVSIGLEVFKCLHKCSPTYITDMFSISASPYDTRGGIKLIQPRVNSTRNGLKSFRYQGAKIWNELPTSVKNTKDVSEFKYRLNEWLGPVGNAALVNCVNLLTYELHFVIARWFYMPTWFYCLEVLYIYIYVCVCVCVYVSVYIYYMRIICIFP